MPKYTALALLISAPLVGRTVRTASLGFGFQTMLECGDEVRTKEICVDRDGASRVPAGALACLVARGSRLHWHRAGGTSRPSAARATQLL